MLNIGIKIAIDLIAVFIIYKLLSKKIEFIGLKNVWAITIPLMIGLIISSHFGVYGVAFIFGLLLIIFPLLSVVAYPQEFRNFLEDFKKRKVSVSNIEKILSPKSQDALIEAVANLSRRRIGSSIIIAREDAMRDVEETGISIGEVEVSQQMIELLTLPNQYASKGALLIRDNKIVAVNCKMPLLKSEQVAQAGGGNRHFGMLGTVNKYDSVVIGTSASSGGITLGGKTKEKRISFNLMVDLQEFNFQNGVTTTVLKERLKTLLIGKGDTETTLVDMQKNKDTAPEPKKKKSKKDKSGKKLSAEEKKALRNDQRNN